MSFLLELLVNGLYVLRCDVAGLFSAVFFREFRRLASENGVVEMIELLLQLVVTRGVAVELFPLYFGFGFQLTYVCELIFGGLLRLNGVEVLALLFPRLLGEAFFAARCFVGQAAECRLGVFLVVLQLEVRLLTEVFDTL